MAPLGPVTAFYRLLWKSLSSEVCIECLLYIFTRIVYFPTVENTLILKADQRKTYNLSFEKDTA